MRRGRHCPCYAKMGVCCDCGANWDDEHPLAVALIGAFSMIAFMALAWLVLVVAYG